MAGERLKFRCYQCNQLLASSSSKAGSIVPCPRCKADLVVPAANARGESDPSSSSISGVPGPAASSSAQAGPAVLGDLDEFAPGLPADLIDLRPEDLRVEAEFFAGLTRSTTTSKKPDRAPAGVEVAAIAPIAEPGMSVIASSRSTVTPPPIAAMSAGFARPEAIPIEVARPASAPLLTPVSPDVPPIEVEPSSLRPGSREYHPVREVVLPATTVLAWSLFGLIGIATSFLAGLMIGHYFWRM